MIDHYVSLLLTKLYNIKKKNHYHRFNHGQTNEQLTGLFTDDESGFKNIAYDAIK